MPESRLTLYVQPSSQLIKCFRGTDSLPSRTVTQVRYNGPLRSRQQHSIQPASRPVCLHHMMACSLQQSHPRVLATKLPWCPCAGPEHKAPFKGRAWLGGRCRPLGSRLHGFAGTTAGQCMCVHCVMANRAQDQLVSHEPDRTSYTDVMCCPDCSRCRFARRTRIAMCSRRTQCAATSAAEPAPPTAAGGRRACTSSRRV